MKQPDASIVKKIEQYAKQGIRVLTLCKAKESVQHSLLGDHEPIGLILIQDVLRKDIQTILSYFYKQGVDIKIISGDDANTVQAIAQKAGGAKLGG